MKNLKNQGGGAKGGLDFFQNKHKFWNTQAPLRQQQGYTCLKFDSLIICLNFSISPLPQCNNTEMEKHADSANTSTEPNRTYDEEDDG